jgi:hypothetical protein
MPLPASALIQAIAVKGLREDKPAKDVKLERPKKAG